MTLLLCPTSRTASGGGGAGASGGASSFRVSYIYVPLKFGSIIVHAIET
jgi:hypothetical protein